MPARPSWRCDPEIARRMPKRSNVRNGGGVLSAHPRKTESPARARRAHGPVRLCSIALGCTTSPRCPSRAGPGRRTRCVGRSMSCRCFARAGYGARCQGDRPSGSVTAPGSTFTSGRQQPSRSVCRSRNRCPRIDVRQRFLPNLGRNWFLVGTLWAKNRRKMLEILFTRCYSCRPEWDARNFLAPPSETAYTRRQFPPLRGSPRHGVRYECAR